jgi:hypothetical protein
MLLAIAVLALLFAALQWVSFAVWIGFVFLAISIALHVAGNYLGTQLRKNHGSAPLNPVVTYREIPANPEAVHESHLGQRTAIAWPIPILTAIGVLGAAAGGCYWNWQQHGQRAGWESFAVVIVAFGVLGGIWTFLSVSFLHITLGAAWHAIRHHSQEEERRTPRSENPTIATPPPANHKG